MQLNVGVRAKHAPPANHFATRKLESTEPHQLLLNHIAQLLDCSQASKLSISGPLLHGCTGPLKSPWCPYPLSSWTRTVLTGIFLRRSVSRQVAPPWARSLLALRFLLILRIIFALDRNQTPPSTAIFAVLFEQAAGVNFHHTMLLA